MASNKPGACCFESNFHEGKIVGKFETVFGLPTYVTGLDNSSDRVIVILTDVYGHDYNNINLIADQLAKVGKYQVYVPDILKGDKVGGPGFNKTFDGWLADHTAEITSPIIKGFVGPLREKIGASAFLGVIGYCFGAKYAVHEVGPGGVADAAALAHPSFVTIEEVEAIQKPVIISAAQTDPIFPAELRHQTEEALIKTKVRFQIDLFGGVSHGFAARGDDKDPVQRYAMDKALADQIQWFSLF